MERAGVALPDVASLRTELAAATDAAARREVIRRLHFELGAVLGAADFRLGKAYGLGRAIADTCRNPASAEELRRELGDARVATLVSWLDDLASAFPPHAGHAVRQSLRAWHVWAADEARPIDAATWPLLRRQGSSGARCSPAARSAARTCSRSTTTSTRPSASPNTAARSR